MIGPSTQLVPFRTPLPPDRARRIFVGADLAPGAVSGPVMDAIKALPIMKNLPAGVSNKPVGNEKWLGPKLARLLTFRPGDDADRPVPHPAE